MVVAVVGAADAVGAGTTTEAAAGGGSALASGGGATLGCCNGSAAAALTATPGASTRVMRQATLPSPALTTTSESATPTQLERLTGTLGAGTVALAPGAVRVRALGEVCGGLATDGSAAGGNALVLASSWLSAAESSRTLEMRSAGSGAIARSTSATSAGGKSGRIVERGGGVVVKIRKRISL